MIIEFSRHAIQRMTERQVSKREVQNALINPDKLTEKSGNFLSIKLRMNGHLLLVSYKITEDIVKVITVIDTSKINKYLNP